MLFKLLVCGGRKYSNFKFVFETLDRVVKERNLSDLIVIHGRSTGADSLAREWAKAREFEDHGYPAKWSRFPRSAGPLRNEIMLRAESPDLVVAFPGGTGTAHMITLAREYGIEVIEASTW